MPKGYPQNIFHRHIDESKEPTWMGEKIKTKEVNISNDESPKIENIGDYWNEEQTLEIINLPKEYQYVFARDYKDLKGLVE